MTRAEEKTRTAFWLEKGLLERCDACWKIHKFPSRNEFVTRAIEHDIITQTLENAGDELNDRLATAIAKATDDGMVKISKGLFRYAVNQEIIMRLMADSLGVKGEAVGLLRRYCIEDVKRTCGKVDLAAIADYSHNPEHGQY